MIKKMIDGIYKKDKRGYLSIYIYMETLEGLSNVYGVLCISNLFILFIYFFMNFSFTFH